MSDGIVTRLLDIASLKGDIGGTFIPVACKEAADEIERLREELKSQTFWAELLSRDKCYCVPKDIGMCMACAYRQTMRQKEEAYRG